MKRTLFFGTLLILVVVAAFAWNMNRPDNFQSTLGEHFSVGENIDSVVRELENHHFNYTQYEYRNDRFRDTSGNPTVSLFFYYPSAPQSMTENCEAVRCSFLISSKHEDRYLWGFIKVIHSYRYLWIFRDHELTNHLENNTYWALIQ